MYVSELDFSKKKKKKKRSHWYKIIFDHHFNPFTPKILM